MSRAKFPFNAQPRTIVRTPNVMAHKLSGRWLKATNRAHVVLALLVGMLSLVAVGCDNGGSSSAPATRAPIVRPTRTPTPTVSPTGGPTPTATGTPSPSATATPVACSAGLRQLVVSNGSGAPVWVSGGGGALRAVCVIAGGSSCLSNPSGGACACGGTAGTLTCPTTTSAPANGGKNCSCGVDADCGAGAGCNTATNLCYFTLPSPTGFAGFTAANPWNWELPAAGDSATFCLAQATVTFGGTSIPSAVWWSGGVGARTGCQADGTNCLTGDCNTSVTSNGGNPVPNANCPVGVGGAQPATIAEFTLQATATDFYDVTLINGANVGEQMAPLPMATQTPGAVDPNYWCTTPGGSCNFNFGQYTNAVPLPAQASPTDYTALLMLTGQPCTVGTTIGCPSANYTCSGTAGALNGVCYKTCATNADCPGTLQCQQAGDSNKYCQCNAQSDCPAGQFCGSQFVPGIGGTPPLSPQVYLQQCGSFQGWWSADDFCGNANNIIGAPGSPLLNCGGTIVDGDSNNTNIASLFGCNGASSSTQAGNVANEASCYNSSASPTAGCCGCATESANPLAALWPAATGTCANNDTSWASNVQPWLANLKQACPTAYSYPFDDFTSTFQCQAQGATNMLGYNIAFTSLVAPTTE